jgi:hypothetical protein
MASLLGRANKKLTRTCTKNKSYKTTSSLTFPAWNLLSKLQGWALRKGRGWEGVHYDRPVPLPFLLDDFKSAQKISRGFGNFAALVPDELQKFLDSLISDLKREIIPGLESWALHPNYPEAPSVWLCTQLSGRVVSKMLFSLAVLNEKNLPAHCTQQSP